MGICGGHLATSGSWAFPSTVILRIELRWADLQNTHLFLLPHFTSSDLALRQGLSCFYGWAVYSRLTGPEPPVDSPVFASHLAVKVLGSQLYAATSCFHVGPGLKLRSPGLPAQYFPLLSHLSDLHTHTQKRPESWREMALYG